MDVVIRSGRERVREQREDESKEGRREHSSDAFSNAFKPITRKARVDNTRLSFFLVQQAYHGLLANLSQVYLGRQNRRSDHNCPERHRCLGLLDPELSRLVKARASDRCDDMGQRNHQTLDCKSVVCDKARARFILHNIP